LWNESWFAIALAWETLFRNPNIGDQPGFFQIVFNIPPPQWLSYGPVPLIITMVIHFFPFALLLVSGALETIDTQLEEGAELLGASRFTILRKITFPIVAPAFLAAFVLTFGRTIGTFALPFLLGAPAQYHTLSTMLNTSLKLGFDPIAYILGIVLIFFRTLVVYGSNKFLRQLAALRDDFRRLPSGPCTSLSLLPGTVLFRPYTGPLRCLSSYRL